MGKRTLLYQGYSTNPKDRGIVLDQENWEYRMARRLKSRLLGLCGKETTITSEKLATALVDIGCVRSNNEARRLVPALYNTFIEYDTHELWISRVFGENGAEMLRIRKESIDLPEW